VAERRLRPPVEGEVTGGEAFREVPGQVSGPEGGEGGEGLWESGRCRVGVWGGSGNSASGWVSSVPTVRYDRRETGLAGQDGGRRGKEVVRCPSLDPVPEAVHASERGGVRGEEVDPVRKYGERRRPLATRW